MAKIDHTVFDRTLAEIDKILDKKMSGVSKRNYVGMSAIGHECLRKLWYDYRIVSRTDIKARGVCAIEDGFYQEDVMAERLRLIPDIELHTEQNGKQIGFRFLDDHFSGHADGMIKGIVEAPEKWHVWEHKSVNQKKFDKLKKLRIDKGEKNALKEWDFVYWTQAQCYMHGSKLDRHYLTVSTPGGRDYISVRTELSLSAFDGILEKANQVIKGKIPDKISKDREFFQCKWCNHSNVCHDDEAPLKNCGTCQLRTSEEKGSFGCFMTKSLKLKNMDPCDDYKILDCFSFGQVVKSEFTAEKVDKSEGIQIKGWN